jgi:hypothetical protein
MEACVSLYKKLSDKPYPIRVLKYDNMCIDETKEIYLADDTSMSPIETHTLTASEHTELNTLIDSYKVLLDAKQKYELAAMAFWKSETGHKCQALFAPDPSTLDRTLLQEKVNELERRLLRTFQIKYKNIEFVGYNQIKARYVLIMLETMNPPKHVHDFQLYVLGERSVEEIPKLWTNKMALEMKKEVEVLYVQGNILPPYRLTDMKE